MKEERYTTGKKTKKINSQDDYEKSSFKDIIEYMEDTKNNALETAIAKVKKEQIPNDNETTRDIAWWWKVMEEARLIIKSADLTMTINNINNVPTGQMTRLVWMQSLLHLPYSMILQYPVYDDCEKSKYVSQSNEYIFEA